MKFYYIFTLKDNFKTWVVGILRFRICFDILDFQIKLCWRYFVILCFGNYFCSFIEKLGFFKS